MEVKVERITDWNLALNAARMTVHKKELGKEPSDDFKRSLVLSEHSPLRMLEYKIVVTDVPYYVTTHLVRHHIGIEKFVATQRDDRTNNNVPRAEKPQGALVDMMFVVNAQALINISKLRLCGTASKETRQLWEMVKQRISEIDPFVGSVLVPNCVYRGFCAEEHCCGYCLSKRYQDELAEYRSLIKPAEERVKK